MDLASDTEWTLSVDDGRPRPVKVPGGGYNSDLQDAPQITHQPVETQIYKSNKYSSMINNGWLSLASGYGAVKDHVLYQRKITIPEFRYDQSVFIELGAVNHGAEVYLAEGDSDILVATHVGPMMPFSAELTHFVKPGKVYALKIKSYPVWHFKEAIPGGFTDFVPIHPGWYSSGWDSKFAYGITKYIHLAVYPNIRIKDVFVRSSVARSELTCDVWIQNNDEKEHTVKLNAQLSSWNNDPWTYPSLPALMVTIPAHSGVKSVIGPVVWDLGPESYWWPNKPFREDYVAKLHYVSLRISEAGKTIHDRSQRFGFVEWTEGPFYYLVNGVRINFISDGTPEPAMSEFDCYSVSPAFLKPTGPGTGCPETWKRYMRLGICANRIHQSTPTEYMMDVADELGFMLIPETGLRGFKDPSLYNDYLSQAVKELAQVCRNHPGVCRYSLANECVPRWSGMLADAIVTVDDTHPLVFEDNQQGIPGRITGVSGAHAYCMMHYVDYPKPAQMISGLGEYAWHWNLHGPNPSPVADGGIEEFIYYGGDMRLNDIAYFAGWDFINYWPNFLEGMNYRKNIWKQSTHPDRTDGLDGWNSPLINHMQQIFHPYLIMDTSFYRSNGKFDRMWPGQIPAYSSGDTIMRSVEIFNDGLFGNKISVRWSLKRNSADGEILAGGKIENIIVKPGFHVNRMIVMKAPETQRKQTLFLVLESLINGKVVFTENQLRFIVYP